MEKHYILISPAKIDGEGPNVVEIIDSAAAVLEGDVQDVEEVEKLTEDLIRTSVLSEFVERLNL